MVVKWSIETIKRVIWALLEVVEVAEADSQRNMIYVTDQAPIIDAR